MGKNGHDNPLNLLFVLWNCGIISRLVVDIEFYAQHMSKENSMEQAPIARPAQVIQTNTKQNKNERNDVHMNSVNNKNGHTRFATNIG